MDGLTKKIYSSNPPNIKLDGKKVFIAGAGGLGSNVAMLLARAGAPDFYIADFDVIKEENLNRQNYFISQTGLLKVDALKANMTAVNPGLKIFIFPERLDVSNFDNIIPADCDVIFECFDSPESKAEFARFCISKRKNIPFIAVSGLAGVGPIENIKVKRINRNFFLVGDEISGIENNLGTLSSRVMAAAAVQAHLGIMILSGLYHN